MLLLQGQQPLQTVCAALAHVGQSMRYRLAWLSQNFLFRKLRKCGLLARPTTLLEGETPIRRQLTCGRTALPFSQFLTYI